MFVARDRLPLDGASARAYLASAESLTVSATFGQNGTSTTHNDVVSPREAVFRRPEGGKIFFSSKSSPDVPPVFSTLRVVLSVKRLEPTPNHSVAHSLLRRKNVTNFLSMSSALSHHSSAPERKSTRLFSCACTLFYKNTRGTPSHCSHLLDCQYSLPSPLAQNRAQPTRVDSEARK